MAKFGKFVGKEFKNFDSNELSLIRETLDNVFGDIGLVSLVDTDSEGMAHFDVDLNEYHNKINSMNKRGDFVHDLSHLKFLVTKEEGQIEKCIGHYEGEPFIQYSIKCWTNGKYHAYKRQYRNDCVFEGKDHYFYDTEIKDFQTELNAWKRNVFNGIDY